MIFAALILPPFFCSLIAFFYYRHRRFARTGRWISALSIFLLFIGGALTWFGGGGLADAEARKSWPFVSGKIVSSKVSSERDRMPIIRYEYLVEGVTRTGVSTMNLPAFGGRSNRRDAAGKVVRQFPKGMRLPVYYNPDNPEISFLKIGPKWDAFMKLGLGVMLTGFAGVLLARIMRNPVKLKSTNVGGRT